MVSYSDGLPNEGTGIPYFYLTTLDPTARNALKDEKASFTVSEYPLGTCGKRDPMNPTCSKISLIGKVCEELNYIQYDDVGCVTIMFFPIFFSPYSLSLSVLKVHLFPSSCQLWM